MTITDLSAPEYAGPGIGITDTCGMCRKPFDLMYPPEQYSSVTVEGEMPELICDDCQDEIDADDCAATPNEGYCPLSPHCGSPCRC